MILTGSLLLIAKITGSILLARGVGKVVQKAGEKFFPYEGSTPYKSGEQSRQTQLELQKIRDDFQREMTLMQIKNNREIASMQIESNEKIATLQRESNEKIANWQIESNKEIAAMNAYMNALNTFTARDTQIFLARHNTYFSLRNTLLQDTIHNFPLNVSPLVLLENNNIDINFLLGNNTFNTANVTKDVVDNIHTTKPVNVFITPIRVDSRVSGRELIASQVFDNVYSSVESLFVNEYSRSSERPVHFYSAAWNKNTSGGLHAADELYYFLKDMPTIVVEPKFDGEKLRLMYSCWGLGYTKRVHFRQEIPIDIDLNSIVVTAAYERSKSALETYKNVDSDSKFVQEQINRCKHNVEMFNELNLDKRLKKRFDELKKDEKSDELNELDNYAKFFYTESSDVLVISDIISSAIGVIVASMADTHHLLASDVVPKLPYIYKQYFEDFADKDMLDKLLNMFKRTYSKLSADYSKEVGAEKTIDYLLAMQPLYDMSGGLSQHDKESHIVGVLQQYLGKRNVDDLDKLFECIDKRAVDANQKSFMDKLFRISSRYQLGDKYISIINQKL